MRKREQQMRASEREKKSHKNIISPHEKNIHGGGGDKAESGGEGGYHGSDHNREMELIGTTTASESEYSVEKIWGC